MIGSDALTSEQFTELNRMHDSQVEELEKAANMSAAARTFLNTNLGKAIRETISTNKLSLLQDCATAKDEELADAQFEYRVWNSVEQVFAVIITGGEEALRSLELQKEEPTNA